MTTCFCVFETAIGTGGIAWGEAGVLGIQLPEPDQHRVRARLRGRFPAVRYSVASRELSLRPVVEPPATRPTVLQGLELLDAIIDIRREIAA